VSKEFLDSLEVSGSLSSFDRVYYALRNIDEKE
jgi:hypothetical protein